MKCETTQSRYWMKATKKCQKDKLNNFDEKHDKLENDKTDFLAKYISSRRHDKNEISR